MNAQEQVQQAGEVDKKPIIEPRKVGEFGPKVDDEVKKDIDALYAEMGTDPRQRGYIINYGSAKEKAKRVKQLEKAIKFLQYDRSRVDIVDGGGDGPINTVTWVVPAGATNPTP